MKLKGWKLYNNDAGVYLQRAVKTPLGYIDLNIEQLKNGKFVYWAWWNNDYVGDDTIVVCKNKDACNTVEEAATTCLDLASSYFVNHKLLTQFSKTVQILENLEEQI